MAAKKEGVEYKVLNALICEDARKDLNRKDILIGVYSGNISVKKFPAALSIVVWMNLLVEGLGSRVIEVRIIGPNKKPLIAGDLNIDKKEPNKNDTISTSTPHALFTLDEPGTLRFQIKTPAGRWKDVVTKEVIHRPEADIK
jgi:hypothetical protein